MNGATVVMHMVNAFFFTQSHIYNMYFESQTNMKQFLYRLGQVDLAFVSLKLRNYKKKDIFNIYAVANK